MSSDQKGGLWRRMFGRRAEDQEPAPETEAPEDAAAAIETEDPSGGEPSGEEPRGPDPDDAIVEPVTSGFEPEAAPEPVDAEREAPADPPATASEGPDPIETRVGESTEADPDPEPEDVLTPAEPETKAGFFRRLMSGLDRTSSSLTEGVTGLFTKRKLDSETLQDLEDVLIQADLGVETAMAVTDRLSESRYQKGIEPDALRRILAEEVARVLEPVEKPFELDRTKKPFVVLVVGVNGTGKTTTIGKIAAKLVRDGRKVVLAAGDTFRAAAVEQLKIWGERTKSHVVARETGSDAAGLVYDALEDAAAAGADALLIDTAGRLQNRTELMAELEKVVRVIKKKVPDAPHAVLLVLDATTGQNALNQVEIFSKAVGVTGLVMTKLDGTARGGILVAISARHQLPVHFVGVGEGVDDLAPFSADDFATAIAGRPEGG
ncbi:signal recognition particle-docking protein FtsY [Amorphus orientalis]|uniref:Signal recognition particle receptor FtsY n=1 Tax=Amorphus orientalis TaxID=649198 RepID=A0AAE4AQW2_9HYPH|nr:signal recognition particle-docking protein FtsY [Amorphus orientalis]MDQ0313588.1 fused signal recognition particle receptor [Amorphus orientalis]